MNPENPSLDRYVLAQARSRNPAVCFLATASGDADGYIAKFYEAFTRHHRCRPSHIPLFSRTPNLEEVLLAQDVIYVGGGNTKSMLAVWRDWGFDVILREACESGVVLAGISAGAICWFEEGITDSFADELKVIDCLGFLKGSCCPHFDGEVERRPAFHKLLQENRILPGYAIDDCAAIHFAGDEIKRVVSSLPKASAYRMRLVDGTVHQEGFQPEFL